jgi:ATP-dependent DNA helicase RecG
MSNAEKDSTMSAFTSGELQVLVSTTVIEVGVNVPNATLMIIENAERFGLSQLHQLRGRVGRGTRKSYCVLVSDAKNEKSTSRLQVMRTTYDGFEIAEKDLILRGPGDFFSSNNDINLRQSGGFEFKMASICNDTELFNTAFSTAKEILLTDPDLSMPGNSLLRAEISAFIYNTSTIS